MFKSEPFTSTSFTTSEDGFPVGNRPVYSDSDREFRKMCLSDGVPYSPATNLEVTAAGGMDLSVAAGSLMKNGAHGWLTEAKTITCTTSASDQVLYIGARLAASDAYFVGDDIAAYTTFVSGTDIAVARVNIPANATAITSGMITDLRGNSTYCGFNTDLRTQAEEAIAAIEATGIAPHAATHDAGAADPLRHPSAAFTVLAASWSSGSYTIPVASVSILSKITANTLIWVQPSESATKAQCDAWRAALIRHGGQSAAASITLTADGAAPAVDIPVKIILGGELV